jgi:hypothetical protein
MPIHLLQTTQQLQLPMLSCNHPTIQPTLDIWKLLCTIKPDFTKNNSSFIGSKELLTVHKNLLLQITYKSWGGGGDIGHLFGVNNCDWLCTLRFSACVSCTEDITKHFCCNPKPSSSTAPNSSQLFNCGCHLHLEKIIISTTSVTLNPFLPHKAKTHCCHQLGYNNPISPLVLHILLNIASSVAYMKQCNTILTSQATHNIRLPISQLHYYRQEP